MDSSKEELSTDSEQTPSLSKGLLIGIIIFALLGSVLALYATQLTFKLTVGGIIEPSECSFSDLFTCDTVLSTGYAKMFGVPVAWFGFLYFFWAFFVAIFALINRSKKGGIAGLRIIFFMTFFAVLITFYKIYQLIMLGVVCPVCVAMYVSIFAIYFFNLKLLGYSIKDTYSKNNEYLRSIFTSPKKSKTSESKLSHPLRYFAILIWFFAMGYLGLRYYENTVVKPTLVNVKAIVTQHFSQPQVEINYAGSPVEGNPDAKVTLVAFSDFECPACKLLASNMKAIMLEYSDRVSFHYMNYPLDKSINKNLQNEIHKNAGLAAIAAICAQEQGKFWEFYNILFENQTNINREFLIETAQEIGLDMNKFNACLDSPEIVERVKRQIDIGKAAGVSGTPSLFINGRKVHYWNSPEVIKSIIKEELKINN